MADKNDQERERREREQRAQEQRAQEQRAQSEQRERERREHGHEHEHKREGEGDEYPTGNEPPETDMQSRYERRGQPVAGAPVRVPTPTVTMPGGTAPSAAMEPSMNPTTAPTPNLRTPEGGEPLPLPGELPPGSGGARDPRHSTRVDDQGRPIQESVADRDLRETQERQREHERRMTQEQGSLQHPPGTTQTGASSAPVQPPMPSPSQPTPQPTRYPPGTTQTGATAGPAPTQHPQPQQSPPRNPQR